MSAIAILLRETFGHDFTGVAPADFGSRFFSRRLTLGDLGRVHDFLQQQSFQEIPGAFPLGTQSGAAFCILTQMHGNEPAGLAGVLLAMALEQAKLLGSPVLAVIGNTVAARQYFEAWRKDPLAIQETRDGYRAGFDAAGNALKDLNRIPSNFREIDPNTDPHAKRLQELDRLAAQLSGTLDIHTARGELVCFTDYNNPASLRHAPIRNILSGMDAAIAGHTSTYTMKRLLAQHPNITALVGIEAGRHEDSDAFQRTAEMTLAMLYNLGATPVKPLREEEDGQFTEYLVEKSLLYSDLRKDGPIPAEDLVYMVKACKAIDEVPPSATRFIRRSADGLFALHPRKSLSSESLYGEDTYAVYQYEELEPIREGQAVAISLPSGVTLHAPFDLWGVFVSKSAELYRDPAVVPWPVRGNDLARKFCYPCKARPKTIQASSFAN